MKKIITIILSVLLLLPSQILAQISLSPVGEMVGITQEFNPIVVKGIKVFVDNPFRFDFILDSGDSLLKGTRLKQESQKLIKYFLTALTVPEENLWVNLNPKEPDRIIPGRFGETEMGRDLLAQDYILKQLTASLMYPEKEIGRKFWDKIYSKLYAEYGHTNIAVDTFNKVWIVPDEAIVFENKDKAFIVKSHLKVMLEEDYFANKDNVQIQDTTVKKVVREILLPEIEREVNQGKNFAQLRQIYNSLILATWFKRNLKESLLGQVYVNKNKVEGIEIKDKQQKQKIYNQYLKAFEQGVYDYVKEEYDPVSQEAVPRRYFAGGVNFGKECDEALLVEGRSDADILEGLGLREIDVVEVRLDEFEGVQDDYDAAVLSRIKKFFLTAVFTLGVSCVVSFSNVSWGYDDDIMNYVNPYTGQVIYSVDSSFNSTFDTIIEELLEIYYIEHSYYGIKKEHSYWNNSNNKFKILQKLKQYNFNIFNNVFYRDKQLDGNNVVYLNNVLEYMYFKDVIENVDIVYRDIIYIGNEKREIVYFYDSQYMFSGMELSDIKKVLINLKAIENSCYKLYKFLNNNKFNSNTERGRFYLMVKEYFDNKSLEKIMLDYIRTTLSHEVLGHVLTAPLINKGRIRAFEYPVSHYKYSETNEVFGLLAEIFGADNTLIKWVFWHTESDVFKQYEDAMEQIISPAIMKKMGYYEALQRTERSFKTFFGWALTLNSEEIRQAAKEIYERLSGIDLSKITYDPKVPKEVEIFVKNSICKDKNTDNAHLSSNKGGIDLNPNKLPIKTTGNNIDFSSFSNLKNIKNINIQGLSPIILNIKTMKLSAFLSVQ